MAYEQQRNGHEQQFKFSHRYLNEDFIEDFYTILAGYNATFEGIAEEKGIDGFINVEEVTDSPRFFQELDEFKDRVRLTYSKS